MGSFSFKCKESNKAISDGDACRIYLLKDGKVLEEMRGHYDTFGRVEDGSFDNTDFDSTSYNRGFITFTYIPD